MEKIDKNTKIKILAMFLMSNLAMYMLVSSNEQIQTITEIQDAHIQRKDYVEIKVKAKLQTSFEVNKPIMISDKKNSFLIKFAILIRKDNNQLVDDLDSSMIGPANTFEDNQSYIISVHESFAQKLIKHNSLILLPKIKGFKTTSTKKRGVNYEISL